MARFGRAFPISAAVFISKAPPSGGGGTAAALSATSLLALSAQLAFAGRAALTGHGTTQLSGRSSPSGQAALQGQTRAALTGALAPHPTVGLAARSLFAALRGTATASGKVSLAARSLVAVSGQLIRPGAAVAQALLASGLIALRGRLALTGRVGLSAATRATLQGKSQPSGKLGLQASTRIANQGRATLTGVAHLAAQSMMALRGRASSTGRATLAAAAQITVRASAAISGAVTLGAQSLVQLTGQVLPPGAHQYARLVARGVIALFGSLRGFLLADPRFIGLLRPRGFAGNVPARNFAGLVPARRCAALLGDTMPQGPDLDPMDVGETVTGAIDFAKWLASGVTIASITSLTVTNYAPAGLTPPASACATLVGSPSIGSAPVALGGSGNANTAVLQQWTGATSGVIRATATIRTSDNQTLIGWVHQSIGSPN